ncbi:GNAT family N-acetyltransferase [Dietzia kunjamensis]|uniref:GNAT family N-acetyltransferase n=1 Tax=Dietzia kunjamensis TaxID=322509 RepID=UPI0039BC4007
MTPPELVIRRAARADVDLVLSAGDLLSTPPTPEWTTDFLDRGSNLLVLALQDEVPVAMLVAVETGHLGASPDLFVYGIRVREDLRGRGIAYKLVEKAVEVAEEAGCSKVWGSMQVPDELTQDPPSVPPEGTTAESSTFVIPIP